MNTSTGHSGSGPYTQEAFPVTIPSASGVYNAYFVAYSGTGCTGAASIVWTMSGAGHRLSWTLVSQLRLHR